MAHDELLYLFSSDQSERYAQDILNILGQPRGSMCRFRYDMRWVEEKARDALKANALGGQRGLVCFSTQHPAKYTPAAFVPVRMVVVTKSESVGNHLFIHFSLSELVALPRRTRGDRFQAVEAFTSVLRERCAAPYDAWASLGPAGDPSSPLEGDFESEGDEDDYFERTAEYLAGTPIFSPARFIRFHACTAVDGSKRQTELTGKPPSLELRAGETYDLELLQFVPEGEEGAGTFNVVADGTVVRVLGEPAVRIGSRYDKPVLQLVAPTPSGYETRSTRLVIEPDLSTRGPRLEIPVRVESSRRGALAKASLTTLGLIVLTLPAAFHHPSTLVRAVLVLAGALLAGWVQVFGAPALNIRELPDWARPGEAPPQKAPHHPA